MTAGTYSDRAIEERFIGECGCGRWCNCSKLSRIMESSMIKGLDMMKSDRIMN